MKRSLVSLVIIFFIFTFNVFGQAVDRNLYKAIDPFDYKLDELKTERGGPERKFKSVVRFDSYNRSAMLFYSLDQNTSLNLTVGNNIRQPNRGQNVTIYYTAIKPAGANKDKLRLDDIDFNNTTEEGIGLQKSTVSPPSNINRSLYTEIDLFEYRNEAETAGEGEERKYKSTALFSGQSGTIYTFVTGETAGARVTMKAERRFPPLKENQGVVVYYTATKGIVDSVVLDDILF